MKKNRIIKMIGAAAATALVAFALAGCSSTSDTDGLKTDTGLTGGVAATVNGAEVEENKVTRAINNFRINNQMEEEADWKEYLQNSQNTPASFRYEVLGQFVDQLLMEQCADQLGVTVDDAEIDEYVEKMSSQYSSEEAWLDAVDQAGWDNINAYRDSLKNSIYNKKVTEHFEAEQDASLTDDELLTAVQDGVATYDGAKKTSYIQFNSDDAETAEDVLARIRNGELTFAQAVEQYSTDEDSKANGGDMGWDKLNDELPASYTTAITEMNRGDVSEVTSIGDNLGIITVTDVWTAPETVTRVSQVPEEFVTEIRSDTVTTKANEDVDNWIDGLHGENDIQVNPMPEKAPYNVDMSDVYSEEEITKINDNALQKLITGVEVTEEEVADDGVIDSVSTDDIPADLTDDTADATGDTTADTAENATAGEETGVTTAEGEVTEDAAAAEAAKE